MRSFISGAAILVLAIALLAACNSDDKRTAGQRNANATGNQQGPQTPPDGIARITVADLKTAVDQGTAFIVDTRVAEAYNHEHIKGSINIPEGTNLDAYIGQLPLDKKIVAYCS